MNDPSPGSGLCIGFNPGAAENYKTIRSVSFSAQKKQRMLQLWQHALVHFILSSHKLLRQLYSQMFGKTDPPELPLPVSKTEAHLELFILGLVGRKIGVKAR